MTLSKRFGSAEQFGIVLSGSYMERTRDQERLIINGYSYYTPQGVAVADPRRASGEVIGLQMGLSFASFFDPVSSAQLSAVSRFLVQVFTLFFVVVNGHVFVLLAVIQSFQVFPVDGSFLQAVAQMRVHEFGTVLFSSALWLALPMMALLLFANLTMGIITRIAPQMNIFAVGFPITLSLGMIGLTATLPMMEQPFLRLLEQSFAVFGV